MNTWSKKVYNLHVVLLHLMGEILSIGRSRLGAMKWILRVCAVTVWICFGSSQMSAQDPQFSQFYSNPLYLNPSLTGAHSGTYRLTSSYRNQWAAALEKPFTTFTAGGDIVIKMPQKGGSYLAGQDKIGVGVLFYNDRVKEFDYNANQIAFYGAFHKVLNASSTTYLSAGLSLGISQRGINYEDLTFEDQFDGVGAYTGATGETLPANALGYSDLSFGIHLGHSPKPNQGFHLGFAVQHFNQPNISFFNNDPVLGGLYDPYQLPMKLTLHGGVSLKTSTCMTLQPRAMILRQGTSSSAFIGTDVRYDIEDSEEVSFHIGGWVRASNNISTVQPTDVILSAGIARKGLFLGLSYDYNLRKYTGNRVGQGTFELSIVYSGEHQQ